jgi:hypothetical protein
MVIHLGYKSSKKMQRTHSISDLQLERNIGMQAINKFIHFLRSSFHFTFLPFGKLYRESSELHLLVVTTGIQHAKQ